MAEWLSNSLSYDIPSPHTSATGLTNVRVNIGTLAPKIVLKSITFNHIKSNSIIIIDGKQYPDTVYFKIDDRFGNTGTPPSVYDKAESVSFDLTKNSSGGYIIGTDVGITDLTINLSVTKIQDTTGAWVGGDFFEVTHGLSGGISARERVSSALWTTTTYNMPPFTIEYEYEKYWQQDDNINDGYLFLEGLATKRPTDIKGIWQQDDNINNGYLFLEGLATERPNTQNKTNWYYNGKNCVLYLNGKEVSTFYNGKG